MNAFANLVVYLITAVMLIVGVALVILPTIERK